MSTRRVVVCLDVKGGRVVKGVAFEGLKDVGNPVELAMRYEDEGADELVFLDVSASTEERAPLWDVVQKTSERLFIPLTLGGGIASLSDGQQALRSGADKVSINSSAIARPELIGELAQAFGSQCVVVSIDARFERGDFCVYTHGGKRRTPKDALSWAQEAVQRGAGEILLTSIDCDGQRQGYHLELTKKVASAVNVPVIASGGAGSPAHLGAAFAAGADAALVAGMLHDGSYTVGALKAWLMENGYNVRGNTP